MKKCELCGNAKKLHRLEYKDSWFASERTVSFLCSECHDKESRREFQRHKKTPKTIEEVKESLISSDKYHNEIGDEFLSEMKALGLSVEKFGKYQFRVEGKVDFFPSTNRYKVLSTGETGIVSYGALKKGTFFAELLSKTK